MKMGSNREHDDDTPVYIRATEGQCSRPIVNPEFFKNVIKIPHGWTTVVYHSNSQQHLDKIMLNGLTVGEIRSEEGRQA